MPTLEQVPEIVEDIRRRLQTAAAQGVSLRVSSEKLEDDWLYVVVIPTVAGVRASDHARFMSQIERERAFPDFRENPEQRRRAEFGRFLAD
jgi:hypothetical protein